MKLIFKILTAPVTLAIDLFSLICIGIISCSAMLLRLVSGIIDILGIAVLVTYSPKNGLILLTIAFLFSPMGLNRNAMVRRIKPFFGEYVTRTAMPRMSIIPLTSLRSIAEQEMIPMQISENRSIASVTGAVRILKISFICAASFSLYCHYTVSG
jgi:hypothetical protein